MGAGTVVFDGELSPRQLKNLTKALTNSPTRLCDRTALILDIFQQRAQSSEGKLQVCFYLIAALVPLRNSRPKAAHCHVLNIKMCGHQSIAL